MAKVQKKSLSLQLLTPKSLDVKIDGKEVRVATNKEENAILNMILASQGRAMIQRALAQYEKMDETPSPKELRDIAGAMRDIASFSAEVYAAAEPLTEKTAGEKAAEKTDDSIDFSTLNKLPTVEGETLDIDASGPMSEPPEETTGEPEVLPFPAK